MIKLKIPWTFFKFHFKTFLHLKKEFYISKYGMKTKFLKEYDETSENTKKKKIVLLHLYLG